MRKSKEFQELVVQMRQKGFYKSKEPLAIDWKAYTANQINDIIGMLEFIRLEVDKVHQPKEHFSVGRPPVDAGCLAKAILFVESLCIPETKAEGWIVLLGHHLGIEERIDDRVLGKAYQNKAVISILEKVFENNKTNDCKMSGDGTGLEGSRKENYESTKKKTNYLTSIVDSREVVQEFDIGNKQECQAMHELVSRLKNELKKDVTKTFNKAKLTLDAGFVDRKLTQLIEDIGIIPYIFPKKNNVITSKGYPAWGRMCKKIIDDVMAWLKEYHIRSHAESFHSSFKRIFGIVTKRLNITVYTQTLCRIIHNNRRKTNYHKLKQTTN
jgi:transposase